MALSVLWLPVLSGNTQQASLGDYLAGNPVPPIVLSRFHVRIILYVFLASTHLK